MSLGRKRKRRIPDPYMPRRGDLVDLTETGDRGYVVDLAAVLDDGRTADLAAVALTDQAGTVFAEIDTLGWTGQHSRLVAHYGEEVVDVTDYSDVAHHLRPAARLSLLDPMSRS